MIIYSNGEILDVDVKIYEPWPDTESKNEDEE
jgi:hypothetical protein